MSFSINLNTAAGVSILDENLAMTSTLAVITTQTFVSNGDGTSVSLTWPSLPGCTIATVVSSEFLGQWPSAGASALGVAISYALGYPSITVTRSHGVTFSDALIVYLESQSNTGYGCGLYNSSGSIQGGVRASAYNLFAKRTATQILTFPPANSYNEYTGINVLGEADYRKLTIAGASNYAFVTHRATFTFAEIPLASNPYFLVEIPDYPNGVRTAWITAWDVWNGGSSITPTAWYVDLATHGSVTPVVYAFVPHGVSAALHGYGIEIYDSSGAIIFSSEAKPLVSFPPQSMTITHPNTTGSATTESFSIPALSGRRPLMSATTVSGAYSVSTVNKTQKTVTNARMKFWSFESATNTLRADWHQIFQYNSGAIGNDGIGGSNAHRKEVSIATPY